MRSSYQKILDFLTFPLRAVTLIDRDCWGLSSLRSERFDYVARFIRGYTLDVGCGPHNHFVRKFLRGHGRGIDVFRYPGLTPRHLFRPPKLPYSSRTFDSVTFIANLNHVPAKLRNRELVESYRCLRPGGNIIVTMGHPLAEIIVHRLIRGSPADVDTQRGMQRGETYFLTDAQITHALSRAGFKFLTKHYFITQWGLNHLFIGWK